MSLIVLEVVEVHHEQRHFGLQALRARQFARQVHEHEPRVRQRRQRIGQRVFLRLLEHHRVVDDRGRLLGDPIEQPPVIVGVDRPVGVVDRDRPDEAFVEHQRADERGLQRRPVRRHAGRFEVGARPRVDERPPVARDPARSARGRSGS